MSDRGGQVASLWSEAIKQYETITKKKLEDPALQRLTTVNALLETVELENNNFSEFRDKGQRIRNVVKYAMTPIELVGNVASGGATEVFPPSAYIFGGVKLLIGAAKGVSEKYDAIIDTMSALKVCDFSLLFLSKRMRRFVHIIPNFPDINLLLGHDNSTRSLLRADNITTTGREIN